MTMTILVAGATGTIGREVVQALARKPEVMIRAGVRTATKASRLEGPSVKPVELDYDRAATVHAALQGVDELFLLIPVSETLGATARLLIDAARLADVQHVVYLSSMTVVAEQATRSGKWHRQVERYLEESGLAWTHLRPSPLLQSVLRDARQTLRDEGRLYAPLGDGRVSYADARDVGTVAAEVLTRAGHPGRAYPITGPAAISLYDLAEALARSLDRRIVYMDVPEEEARRRLQSGGYAAWEVESQLELLGLQRRNLAASVAGTVRQLTGREALGVQRFASEVAPVMLAGD